MKFLKTVLSTAVATALLSACGGDGSSSDDSTSSSSETTSSKTTMGRISGFGSVIVNGVHYDVESASVTSDGLGISEADLKVGMIVRIKGQTHGDGTGTAISLEFDDDLEGPVESVDLVNKSFVVLGQTVLIGTDTVFDGLDLDTLTVGNVVEVSGYFDTAGSLRASLIELSDSTEFEVKGRISGLDANTETFILGNLTVSYAGAVLEDIAALADGLFVEVKTKQALQNGTLVADEIEGEEEGVEADEGEELEISGIITGFTSADDFAVNGQRVRIGADTEFENGSVASLAGDIHVEVEGTVDAEGVLVAEEISFVQESQIEIEASIDAVNTSTGSITVLGREFRVDERTAFRDDSASPDKYLNLDKLLSSQWVEVKAYKAADGSLMATSIERHDTETDGSASLQGPVEEIASSNFTIVGITVTTGADTGFEPQDFVPQVGDLVKAEGALTADGVFAAISVERED